MKKILKIIGVLIFIGIFIGTLIFLWEKSRPETIIYDTIGIKIDTIRKTAIATGKISPRNEVLIKPQIPGIISDIYCHPGQMVKKGDIIAKIKVIPDMSALNSAKSRVNQAKINFDQIQRENNRINTLYLSGASTTEEKEQSDTELKYANEELIAAQNNLEIVQNGYSSQEAELSNTQIRSTIDGMVLNIPIKVGNSVIQANNYNDETSIATIADLTDMIFTGKMDESEINKLKEGMPVEIIVGALQNITLNATLEYISPKATDENGIVMFEIKAAINVPDSLFLRAGYSGNAIIITDYKTGIKTIPESTVIFHNNKTYVNVLNNNSTSTTQTFSPREIKLGLSDGVKVEILEGLDGTEKLQGQQLQTR